MRVLVLLVSLLLASSDARAQDALSMKIPSGEPLVRDPEIVIPTHDPVAESILFRMIEVEGVEADIPFLVDRTGIRVLKADLEATVSQFLADALLSVLVCSFPELGPYDLTRPEVPSRFCTIRRQP